ncbi:hypothetical protein BDV93DRAFT_522944 [Ceratobasidium sp. AG-I]|nr:hypothetical protein BDV93DRAFT_522944 [Ceratobasidium sp. AG-I]
MVSGASSFKDTGQIGPKVANAQMIEWRYSDGDVSRRPPGVSFVKNQDREGNVNFYRPIPDTEDASVNWRREIGTYIGAELGLPAGKVYWMKGWPSGYAFYDHQKGRLPNPRHDLYLSGAVSTLRFRSKNEFLPHAKWLMTDPTLDTRNCLCKYCTKTKSQVEVNQNLKLPGLRHAPESHLRGTRPKAETPALTHARRRAIRETAQKEKSKPPKRVDQPPTALPERIRDLNSSGRIFRILEVVWVALRRPIYLKADKSAAIDFWPAIVYSFSTKNVPTPHAPGDPNYSIECRFVFNVRLLGVNHSIVVYQDRLLPQLAYNPPETLLNMVKECEPSRPLDPNFQEYTVFNPFPEFNADLNLTGANNSYQDALPAFCLALHITACLTPLWCTSHPYLSDDQQSDADELFQGLWWGAERIWLDDLVRLRPSREELDPENAMGLLPTSSSNAVSSPLFLRITYITPDKEDTSELSISVGGDLYELVRESEAPPEEVKEKPKPRSSGAQESIFGAPTGLLPINQPNTSSRSMPLLNNARPDLDTFAQPQRYEAVPPIASTSSGLGGPPEPPVAETNIPMPAPPPGYVFRRLLTPGFEMIVDVGAIGGRYYPTILRASAVDTVMRAVNEGYDYAWRIHQTTSSASTGNGTVDEFARELVRRGGSSEAAFAIVGEELVRMLALQGLFVSFGNAMEPEKWAKGRLATIKGAELNGRKVLYAQWKRLVEGSSDVEMAGDVEMVDP